jgi:hypothetical protein
MRIAVFDVSHWHFPLYIPALTDPGTTVIGISDQEGFAGPEMARRLDCPLLSRQELLERDFDFALVFSRHSEMAAVARAVIAKRRPFLIEKPCGLDTSEVAELRRANPDGCRQPATVTSLSVLSSVGPIATSGTAATGCSIRTRLAAAPSSTSACISSICWNC